MQNWSCTHPCGHSSVKYCGHVTLRLRVCFPHPHQPNVSKNALLSSYTHIQVHLGIREKLSLHSPFRCTHIFFQKSFYVLTREFPKENWQSFSFKKRVGFLVSFFSFGFFFFQSISFKKKNIRNGLQELKSLYFVGAQNR